MNRIITVICNKQYKTHVLAYLTETWHELASVHLANIFPFNMTRNLAHLGLLMYTEVTLVKIWLVLICARRQSVKNTKLGFNLGNHYVMWFT